MTLEERAREVAARFGFHAPSMAMRKAMLALAREIRDEERASHLATMARYEKALERIAAYEHAAACPSDRRH